MPISSAGNRTVVARDGNVESAPVTVEGVDTAAEADPGPNESNGTGDEDDSEATDDGIPGFGVVVAVLALLAAAAASRYRGR